MSGPGAPPRTSPWSGVARPSRSIVRRLMLALTASIALASVGTVLGLAVLDTRRQGAELERSADAAVRELARVVEPALWDLDMERAGQIGAAFAEDPRVVQLVIRDHTTDEVRSVQRGPLVDTIARVTPVLRNGKLLGSVGLTFTRAPLRRAVREQVIGALRASLVALLAAFLVVRLLVRRLLDEPLDELAANVATYDDARAVAAPTPSPYEEFETLHEVLHTMRTRIAHQLGEQLLLRTAIEQSPDGVLITDTDGCIVYANEAFSQITGYAREAAIGNTPRLLRSGAHPASFYAEMWAALGRGETWRGRITNRRADGREIVQEAIIAPVRDEAGRITNYIAHESDITQELAREERFRHAQRMDAVGQLAGGIAHDFNNILGAINLELELLELEHALPTAVARVVHDVRSSAQRAANLTRQLLMFSRRQVMTMHAHELNGVVADLLRMLSRVIGEQVTIHFHPAPGAAVFEGDAGMIEQVVMNLCVNARDAMPAGGTLGVRIDRVTVREGDVPETEEAAPGEYLRLRISDTGTGMSAETRSRLFEPFFTTKDVGKGTGLGLATAHGLVAQHHGFIAVDSTPGVGSTFSVYLPASAATVAEPVAEAVKPAPAASAATVLLVEDEAAVRKVIGRSLRRLGYRVVEASGGAEALDRWAESPAGGIQLLLTDMVMPEQMSGLDLAVRLRDEDPSLKVVIMSGYDVRLVGDNAGLINDIDFLGKPFTITALGEVVTRLLGGPPEGAAAEGGPGEEPGPGR